MLTISEAFRMLAPEFIETGEEELAQWIELVKPEVSYKAFGSSYPHAVALLTAHKMKLAGKGESTIGKIGDFMNVASYTEGGTSVSFSTNQQSSLTPDASLTTTLYGMQFLELRRSHTVPITIQGV